MQRCGSLFCFILWRHQSSQVDLFAKSEIFNGVDVVGDAACVTPQIEVARTCFSLF